MPIDPLVSVIVPVYNGAAFVDAALASVAGQTHPRLEIIVVDDGSTDDSRDLVAAQCTRDDRIRTIQTMRGGPEHARNAGVEAATGDFIAHLDQDDVAGSGRIATQLAWMQEHGVDVCGTCTRVFGDDRYVRWVPELHADILLEFVFRPAMIHSTTLLPAGIAKAHPFDEQLRCGGFDLLTRLSCRYRLGNVPQALVKYRRHDAQRARVERDVVRAHGRGVRARHFHRLFPDASADDCQAIMRVADGERFKSDDERARAARWMAYLSASSDPTLRNLMAERWAAANSGATGQVG